MLATGLDLLENVSPDLLIEYYHQIPARELVLQVKNMLKAYN